MTTPFRLERALNACKKFHDPSHELKVFGITGTKGKTSTTTLLTAALNAVELPCGIIGTVENRFKDFVEPAQLTTPGPDAFQGLLRRFANAGAKAVCAEVSSHALDQARPWGTRFHGVFFTNLSHDHLDYHSSMKDYFAAKARLFLEYPSSFRVLNVDDSWGQQLHKICCARRDLMPSTILTSSSEAPEMVSLDVHLPFWDYDPEPNLWKGVLVFPKLGTTIPLQSILPGQHNASNLALVAGGLMGMGLGQKDIAKGLAAASMTPISGRFEPILNQKNLRIFVDYAHSPASLDATLRLSRSLAQRSGGRSLVVFGCGGDRDTQKRPIMGRLAETLADLVMITSDNPRTEDPESILKQILEGTSQDPSRILSEPDRSVAITKMIGKMQTQDILVIAGKGHETYQVIGTERRPFDDRAEVRKALTN